MRQRVYLDHNATTPLLQEALEEMLPYYREDFGNPSSSHIFGQRAREGIEKARWRVARAISCTPEEVIFTSSGTEANNLAIKGIAFANKEKGNHIITSKIEHHALLSPCKWLEGEGFCVTYLDVDRFGMVDPNELLSAITKETILVTIMHANNEVGTIQPIRELSKIARERGVYFHTDAVSSFGKIEVDVDKLGVDLLSISSHKIYGPKGVGALYVRKGTRISPLIHGGGHERGRRAGTEDVAGIVGFGKAAELAIEEKIHIRELRDRLYNGIIDRIDGVTLNGHPTHSLPNTINLLFRGVDGETLMAALDLKGIATSVGSACSQGPSHVLLAMGLKDEEVGSSIRFSLGRGNRREEIDYVLEVLPRVVNHLRSISPL